MHYAIRTDKFSPKMKSTFSVMDVNKIIVSSSFAIIVLSIITCIFVLVFRVKAPKKMISNSKVEESEENTTSDISRLILVHRYLLLSLT